MVGGNGTAQVEYSKYSDRWTFPDYFYTIDTTLENGMSQRIITIDTPLLVGVYSAEVNMDEHGKPPYPEYAAEKWEWLEQTLKDSDDFDFLFVAGHYMIIGYGY